MTTPAAPTEQVPLTRAIPGDSGSFAKVPVHLLTSPEVAGLKGASIKVLVALLGHMDCRGVCWPGLNRIGQISGLSRSSVLRGLVHLEAAGLVRRRHDLGRSNHYTLLVPPSCLEVDTGESGTPVSPAEPETCHPRDGGGTEGDPQTRVIRPESVNPDSASPGTAKAKPDHAPRPDKTPYVSRSQSASKAGPPTHRVRLKPTPRPAGPIEAGRFQRERDRRLLEERRIESEEKSQARKVAAIHPDQLEELKKRAIEQIGPSTPLGQRLVEADPVTNPTLRSFIVQHLEKVLA
ncbi:MAG: helix-turn-helix domain-containing protein [Planctomycetota bacterium]